MRISDMVKSAQNKQIDEQEVQRRISSRRPMNLMMKPGGTGFNEVTEADAPAEMRQKVLDLVRNEFVNNYGAPSESNAYRDLVYAYARQFPDDADISKAVHGMYALNLSENERLQKLAEDNFPGWKPGKPFDKAEMWKLIENSFDMKV